MRHFWSLFLSIGLSGILISCQSAQSSIKTTDGSPGAKNYPLRISFMADYVTVISSQRVALWNLDNVSQPRTGRLSTGGQGYMTLRDRSVNADLPYYGQRDLFRDVYEQPEIILKDKKLQNITYARSSDQRTLALEFDVALNTERFHFRLVIMQDKRAFLLLQSPHRQSIRYEGRVEAL